MNLHISRGKDVTILYVAQSVRTGKKVQKKLVEKLGSTASIMKREGLHNDEEAIQWARDYIASINDKHKTENAELKLSVYPNKPMEVGQNNKVKLGHIVLQKLYYALGLNIICKTIQKRHKVTYDLNHIMESLLYARMIDPSSKLRTCEEVAKYYSWEPLELHQVYRSLSVFAKEYEYIQSQLFLNSKKVLSRDTSVLYYDCTNFFCETESASGLRQYGFSKEHRPNPIVEFGLFMDGSGYPLGFCVHQGNISETQTMTPLEKKIIDQYSMNEFIISTDAAMAIADNKAFNSIGNKHFVTTQPIKKLSDIYQQWALDHKGWYKYIPLLDDDTDAEKEAKKQEIAQKTIYDLDTIDEEQERNTVFYKKIGFKQSINEDGKKVEVDQTLYVTYSIKYRNYMRTKRNEHIQRAIDFLKRGSNPDNKNSKDYKRFISKHVYTQDGEVADKYEYFIDESAIANEEKFDGFYGVSSDISNDIGTIFNVNRNRWEIEESFRIMKTDFKTRPIYLYMDERIKAHMMTCFLTLFLYRMLEKHYMHERYTASEIINAIRDMEGVKLGDGIVPAYEYSRCAKAILIHTSTPLDYQYLTNKTLDKIIKNGKINSEKIIRLNNPDRKPVGRPSKGTKTTLEQKKHEKKDQI